ncbi:hypothetical protein M440DRAFT_1190026 [Trichoderma longibrachiatum ATCC 18648]|uniref:Uncharacterized protein n=1 Tax=Trichoderma longibrachiatum ATCC 18648 TaxID=983965 RepID=A0A2T4C9R9_TRILO|nr:hypothetical protein M440DRAFT_1190026 [Trichoderma longibrachiatum ATCC 18648]
MSPSNPLDGIDAHQSWSNATLFALMPKREKLISFVLLLLRRSLLLGGRAAIKLTMRGFRANDGQKGGAVLIRIRVHYMRDQAAQMLSMIRQRSLTGMPRGQKHMRGSATPHTTTLESNPRVDHWGLPLHPGRITRAINPTPMVRFKSLLRTKVSITMTAFWPSQVC